MMGMFLGYSTEELANVSVGNVDDGGAVTLANVSRSFHTLPLLPQTCEGQQMNNKFIMFAIRFCRFWWR